MLNIYQLFIFYLNLRQYSIFNTYLIISLTYYVPAPISYLITSAMIVKKGVVIKIMGLWIGKPLFKKQQWEYF